MKNAISILLVLGLVLGLGLTVYAVDGEPDVTETPPSDPTIPVVALDDGTIQTIVDALASTEPDGDVIVDDTEPTIPQALQWKILSVQSQCQDIHGSEDPNAFPC